MKSKLFLVLLFFLLIIPHIYADTLEFNSKIDSVYYSNLKIEVTGNVVYFERTILPNDSGYTQRLYNISDLSLTDHELDVDSSDNETKYWYIPFNDSSVKNLKPNGYQVRCEAGDYICSSGECAWQPDQTCDCGDEKSNPCRVIICPNGTGSVFKIFGSGVIVQGTKVVQRYNLIGSYVNTYNAIKYMKLSISVDGSQAIITRIPVDSDSVGQRVYNLTPYPFETNDSNFVSVNTNGEDKIWFLPFNPNVTPYNSKEIFYYYECCGNCNPGECDWRDAGLGCKECRCMDSNTTSCTVTRHQTGPAYSSGGGVIINVENIAYTE